MSAIAHGIDFDAPIAAVAGKHAVKVEKALDVHTVGELLTHYPRAYVDKTTLDEQADWQPGDFLTVFGKIVRSETKTWQDRRTHKTAWRQEVVIESHGQRLAMTWFDRLAHLSTYRAKQLGVGTYGMFSGKLGIFREDWQLTNPDTRTFGEGGEAADRFAAVPNLIPMYPTTGKLQSWEIEDAIRVALDLVEPYPDVLPPAFVAEHELLDIRTAYRWIHGPDAWAQKVKAEQRLKYDEAFVTQAVLAKRRAELAAIDASPRRDKPGGLLDRFDERLPFELTGGQLEVSEEILGELARSHPMHRLLQGEVGSGKTVVALRAMLRVVDAGGQAALLAPTEVLAQQHFRSISLMLGDLGLGGTFDGAEGATQVALLTGSMGVKARKQTLGLAASGDAGIVIGTHALLEEHVQFFDLGLVVVDEQHRFGVEQRAALTVKAGVPPHVLVMTATPIPRTVAMTVFGDLDTSTLTELPSGRSPIQTNVINVPENPAWLERAWQRIREEVAEGRQAYVVCARIVDEPPKTEDGQVLRAVEEVVPELRDGPLKGLRVEMLHGKMPPDEKDRIMRSFVAAEIDVLVSTTVIEVGVDVPNATVMVILDADRFGVSQLHQLRGRIGRGGHAGLCLLVTEADPEGSSMERLDAVAGTRDGFELSRIDLAQRREGDVLGTRQSGGRSTLKLLSVLKDEETIITARAAASALVFDDPELKAWPDLAAAVRDLEATDAADYLDMS